MRKKIAWAILGATILTILGIAISMTSWQKVLGVCGILAACSLVMWALDVALPEEDL